MADENKPAFYPRVGRTIAKNFRSAQPPAFIEDPRAMDLPQYGDVDLSVPSRENLEMARRMAERDAQLKRQQQADRSPLEKVAGTLQTGRLLGSALTQAINSIPTRIAKGDEAADKFMQERMYQPTQPLAYEYAGDIGDFLEKLETQYKIPPILPEAVALQYLTGPATSQAIRTAGRGAEQAGRAIERRMEPVVKGALESGGLPREMVMAMGQGTRSNVYLPHTPKKPDPNVGSRFKTEYVGNLAPKKEFDIEANQDSSVMANPWDLTSRGEKVLEVSDTPLTSPIITEGGHDFARDLANIEDTIGGASGRQIAERMQDRVNDAYFANMMDKGSGRVFTMPSTMDYTGSNYSTMPTDVIMDFVKQAELKPKDVTRITDDLRTFMFETERGKFKNAAPVGSPEFLRQLREGGEGFSAGDLRKGFMDRMSKSEYQKMLGYNIEDVYAAIHDPALKGVPKGFVGNTMIETSPFAEVRPSSHQSYDTANAGKYAGSMPSMPIELMMPDLYQYLEKQVLSSPNPNYKNMTPNQMRTMIVNMIEKRGSVISQPINQRVVDNVMRYKEGLKQGHFKPNDYDSIMEFMRRTGGYKDGGTVKKPAGSVKQPAAYIDGSEFVEAAQKYGIKDSMGNLNMIVNLVNKGFTVDDAARQVSDSGMHKAEGGEVSGDDLILEERPL
jgi:hypothetical protein